MRIMSHCQILTRSIKYEAVDRLSDWFNVSFSRRKILRKHVLQVKIDICKCADDYIYTTPFDYTITFNLFHYISFNRNYIQKETVIIWITKAWIKPTPNCFMKRDPFLVLQMQLENVQYWLNLSTANIDYYSTN